MKRIVEKELGLYIKDREALKVIRKTDEPVFLIKRTQKISNGPLLRIEINIRKLERLGAFKK